MYSALTEYKRTHKMKFKFTHLNVGKAVGKDRCVFLKLPIEARGSDSIFRISK
jgi:hypothetical protein